MYAHEAINALPNVHFYKPQIPEPDDDHSSPD